MSLDMPFELKDCALAALSTGRRAQNLRELRDGLVALHPGTLYAHFCGGLLRPRFDHPEYGNDLAAWAGQALHDKLLAERLAAIDPSRFTSHEELLREVLEVVEERLDESEHVPWAKADQQFHFLRSQLVVFDTHRRFATPAELAAAIPGLSAGSVFFHFVDARWRSPVAQDDFSAWLQGRGPALSAVLSRLATLDTTFISLTELRQRLAEILSAAQEAGAA